MRFLARLKFLFTNRDPYDCGPAPTKASNSFHQSGGFTFTVYSASGGKVMQVTDYADDERDQRLYVLPDSDDIVDEIAKIVTLELMRR